MPGDARSAGALRLSDILVAREFVSERDIGQALDAQARHGGRIGSHLVRLGLLDEQQLQSIIEETPVMPRSVAETGLSRRTLLNLVLKQLRFGSCEIVRDLVAKTHLSQHVIQEIMDEAVGQRLVYVSGAETVGVVRYLRYGLSEQGRDAAGEALEQSGYLGPAPVSFEAYKAQLQKQRLVNERISLAKLEKAFAGLIVPPDMVRRITPAVSSGRTILLYGPPGNGKTSIGSRVADAYRDPVFVPFAVEVEGQIIKVYDRNIHRAYAPAAAAAAAAAGAQEATPSLHMETFDARWMYCRRPVAMAGGEMTLDMLELQWDAAAKCYDAPLHMKALNGVFLIDDFGRQRCSPTDLLNRWIVPLESRIDYLRLNTGNTIEIPFDELVLFSTNLAPADLMDPAFLRRIPYKIEVQGPTDAEYRQIFRQVARSFGLSVAEDVLDLIIGRITGEGRYALASFQPRFICEQASEVCRCFELPPVVTAAIAAGALENLYVGLQQ
jgi:predicted ATPase with chaperone activity